MLPSFIYGARSAAEQHVHSRSSNTLRTDQQVDGLSSSGHTMANSFSSLCSLTFRRILCFVGAHNLEFAWACEACKPYWYNWYCHLCRRTNRFHPWTPERHYGACGQSCGCCRAAMSECFACCDACVNLWCLKVTCGSFRRQLCDYDGR